MACNMKLSNETYSSERGSGAVVALVLVVIAALVGVLAVMSGKINLPNSNGGDNNAVETASATDGEVAKEENPVLAKINGEAVKRQDVIDLVNVMPAQMRQIPLEQLFPMALEQLINNKIIDKKANKAGLEKDKFVKEQLKQAKEQIIRTKFLEDSIKAGMTDERLQEAYTKYVANFEEVEEVKASHILVDDEKLAKSIIVKLNKGGDFVALAKENSKDGSSENGGDLGYFSEKEVVPEFAKAAFGTKIGEYTKTPVKSTFGYHIIKIEEKRNRPAAEFAQAKPYLEKELQRAVLDELVLEWRTGADIERFDINGKPIADQEPAAGSETEEVASEEPVVDDAENAAVADEATETEKSE